jgi:hypothetical protein
MERIPDKDLSPEQRRVRETRRYYASRERSTKNSVNGLRALGYPASGIAARLNMELADVQKIMDGE